MRNRSFPFRVARGVFRGDSLEFPLISRSRCFRSPAKAASASEERQWLNTTLDPLDHKTLRRKCAECYKLCSPVRVTWLLHSSELDQARESLITESASNSFPVMRQLFSETA
jgi:hypothetical protein